MQDSIFTKIIKGEIPCHKVYEDAKTMAFLDIDPLLPGHTLVVPKVQVDQFDDLAADDYQALFHAVQKVARHLKEVLGTKRVILHVLGFDIPHAHVHLLPADEGKQYFQAIADHYADKPNPYAQTNEELAKMADRLRMEDEL
jgi:histidine triad (HIT) family protein